MPIRYMLNINSATNKTHINKTINMEKYLILVALTILVIILNLFQTVVQATEADQANLRDPIIWDSNSLYENHAKILNQMKAVRNKRSLANSSPQNQNQQVVDACQSKMEVLTPYYATNSKGKLRNVVNSELMQQAIQVETCVRSTQSASKCNLQPDCGCEQKYKWHRLLVLDPRDDGIVKGLTMDWFLFPSSCICRCKNSQSSPTRQFLRAIKR